MHNLSIATAERATAERATAERLVRASQDADAALDADAFVKLLTPDVTFRLGSSPELHGREAVHAGVRQLFDSMRHIRHMTRKLLVDGNEIFLQAEVEFVPLHGPAVSVPYVNVLTVEADGLISQYRIHIDISPLFAGRG
jgi:ketosteroid isomerase-like protein